MLAFFRRALGSWIVVALLGLVVIAFIVTGVGNPTGLTGATADPDVVSTVGKTPVTLDEVSRRAQTEFAQAKQSQPDLTMARFLASAGGVGALVDQIATGRALEVWAAKKGLVASDRLVDAEIAGIPAFRSPSGAFDERTMQGVLAQQHMTLASLREGIRGDLLRRQLLVPLTNGLRAPQGLTRAYAALMLSRRIGEVAFVPVSMAAVPTPNAADVATWYKTHLADYSLPERRVLRYAPLSLETVPVTPPTDAEIAAQYRADAAKYAATEQRTLAQVVLPDEKAARAFAAKVAGGTPFATAATEAGIAAADTALGKQTKAAFVSASAPAIADAVFVAAQGATVGPLKSPLGWHIVHVDAIERTAAKSLAQARGEIADALLKKRRIDALSALGQKIEDALSGGATFDDVAKANGLKVVTTPPLIANGGAPGDAAFKADPTVMALLKAAYQMAPEDQPTLETVSPDTFALLALGSIVPGAAMPLDQIRARVTGDIVASRAAATAKAAAQGIVDKVNKGAALGPLLAAGGFKPAVAANASQLDAMRLQQVPPPLRILFTLAPGRTGLVAGQGGYFIVHVDHVEESQPALVPAVAAQLDREMGSAVGGELVEQFARAIRPDVPVTRNPAAIAALGKQLTGQAPAGQ